MTKGDKEELICHECRSPLVQIGYNINEKTVTKWYFLCSKGCPLKYTIIKEPFEQEQVNIILGKGLTFKETSSK